MFGSFYFLASVVLFAALLATYICLVFWKRREYHLDAGDIATIVGAAFAVPAGVRIIIVAASLSRDLGALGGYADRGYIMIGPAIVVLGSFVAVGRIFRKIWRSDKEVEIEE